MEGKYLYGVTRAGEPSVRDVAGPANSRPVYTVAHNGLRCVLSHYSGPDFASLPREGLVHSLLAHQRVAEEVMKHSPVLPMKLGTLVGSDHEARDVLRQGESVLAQALRQMADRVEIEVAATWDLPRVLGEIASQEEFIQLKEALKAASVEQLVHTGKRVKEALDQRREAYQAQIVESLRGKALEVQPHPLVRDEMVASIAFLVERGGQGDFQRRVEELHDRFQGQLDFRLIGPLPPYTFSTVEVLRLSPEELLEARQLLGLGDTVSRGDIKAAYRREAARAHPDARPGLPGGDFQKVREAANLLLDYCQAKGDGDGPCSLRPQAVDGTFLVTIQRQDGRA